jgi:hypothetical protein
MIFEELKKNNFHRAEYLGKRKRDEIVYAYERSSLKLSHSHRRVFHEKLLFQVFSWMSQERKK